MSKGKIVVIFASNYYFYCVSYSANSNVIFARTSLNPVNGASVEFISVKGDLTNQSTNILTGKIRTYTFS